MPKKKVLLAVASYQGLLDGEGKPRCAPFVDSLTKSLKELNDAGYEAAFTAEQYDAYVQHARNTIIRRFRCDDIFTEPNSSEDSLVFLDDDLQWSPQDLIRLIETPGEVVSGVYRRKLDNEDYPVVIHTDENHRPILRNDGCIKAALLPAGFLVIRRSAIDRLCELHPELSYDNYVDGKQETGFYDLFPQGVQERRWWGEDYAFCRLWEKAGGETWVVPNIWLHHFGRDAFGRQKFYTGNYHEFLLRCAGGSKSNLTAEAVSA